MAVKAQDTFREAGKAKIFKFGRGRGLLLALGALLLGSVLLLGCQPAQPAATPAKAVEKPVRGGTLRVVVNYDYDSLDPQGASMDTLSTSLMYETYIYRNEKFEMTKEGLFKDWTVSPDGKGITVKLREGVKFHDGTDFDAAVVKFNIERVKDPATKSPFRGYYEFLASVEVVDSLTARFNLSQPDASLLSALGSRGGMVVSPAAVKKHGQDFGRNPVGTGPFQIVQWKLGDRTTVKRFDGYWKKDKDGNQLPYLDEVTFSIVPDDTTAVANVRAGQADVYSYMPAGQLPLVQSDPNLVTKTGRQLTTHSMVIMNAKRPPFNNKAVREAVALAVDREAIVAAAGGAAYAVLDASIMIPRFAAFYDPKAGAYPARDLAKAKAKMAEAGYPSGGLKARLPASGDSKVQQVLKANLAEIGIEADIQAVAKAEMMTIITAQEGESKYEILHHMTPTGNPEVGDMFGSFYHSKAPRNIMGPYNNPQVDKLIEKARSIYDEKERASLYQQAATLIREDVPVVPTFIQSFATVTTKKVRNVSYNDVYAPNSHNGFQEAWLAQ